LLPADARRHAGDASGFDRDALQRTHGALRHADMRRIGMLEKLPVDGQARHIGVDAAAGHR
jgi:hypothetical protein